MAKLTRQLADERQSHSRTAQQLDDERTRSAVDQETAQNTITQLRDDNRRLQTSLNGTRGDAAEAAATASRRIEELQSKLDAVEAAERSASSALRRERLSFQKDLAAQAEEVDSLRQQLDQATKDRSKSHHHNKELRQKLEVAQEAAAEAAGAAEREAVAAAGRHAKAAAALERQLESLRSQLASAQQATSDGESTIAALRREKASLVDAASTAAAKAEADRAQLQSQLADARNEEQRAAARVTALEKSLQAEQAARQRLEDDTAATAADLRRQLDSASERERAAVQRVAAVRASMREETDAAIEAADRKHLQLRNDAHEALSRVSALEAQLASEKRAAADAEATAKNELQQARALIESLQRRLTTAEELETKSSSDLAAQRQQAARTGAVTEMKLRSMERQLKDARSEASQAQSRVDELETEHAAYRKTAQQRELDLQVCHCTVTAASATCGSCVCCVGVAVAVCCCGTLPMTGATTRCRIKGDDGRAQGNLPRVRSGGRKTRR